MHFHVDVLHFLFNTLSSSKSCKSISILIDSHDDEEFIFLFLLFSAQPLIEKCKREFFVYGFFEENCSFDFSSLKI